MRIGFIGLGIMGSRMAANLLEGGHELVVHNRTQSKADPLAAQGATWADTPAQVAPQVEILITMLAHPEAVRQMALGDGGFLDHFEPGALWIDCSTVNPSFSRRMAEKAQTRGVRFVDAPVAGTKGPAAEGTLLFLVGGEAEDVEECRNLFEIMGRKVIHVGGHGLGTSLKMVFNSLLADAMAAFAEGLVLGESLGISREMLLEVLIGSAVVPPFVSYKRQKIAEADYAADFPLKWMRKDLQLASLTAYEEGVPFPLGNVAKEIFALAAGDGLAEADFAAIYHFLADKAEKIDESSA